MAVREKVSSSSSSLGSCHQSLLTANCFWHWKQPTTTTSINRVCGSASPWQLANDVGVLKWSPAASASSSINENQKQCNAWLPCFVVCCCEQILLLHKRVSTAAKNKTIVWKSAGWLHDGPSRVVYDSKVMVCQVTAPKPPTFSVFCSRYAVSFFTNHNQLRQFTWKTISLFCNDPPTLILDFFLDSIRGYFVPSIVTLCAHGIDRKSSAPAPTLITVHHRVALLFGVIFV